MQKNLIVENTDLAKVLHAVVEATLRPERWDGVCKLLGEYLDAPLALISEYDSSKQTSQLKYGSKPSTLSNVVLDNLTGDRLSTYDQLVHQRLIVSNSGIYFSEAELHEVSSETALPYDQYRADSLAVSGGLARGGLKLNQIGPIMDVLSLHLKHFTPKIPDRLRADIALISPVIGSSIENGRIVRNLSRGHSNLLDAFDLFDFGAVICDADGRITISNARFCDMANDRDGFKDISGTIVPTHLDDELGLARLMSDLQAESALSKNLMVTMRRRSGKRPMVVKAAIIRGTPLGSRGSILLLFLDPDNNDQLNAEGLERLGLLSAAEFEICEMLVRGYQTSEISTVRDTSIATVRSQIKSASAKLACTSRLDLLRLAMATSAPIRNYAKK